MKIAFVVLASVFVTTVAQADYALSRNNRTVRCSGEDNQSVVLNSNRTTLKYTVEGESLGAKRILKVETDGKTFMTYMTEDMILTLSDDGDTFMFKTDQEPESFDCK